MPIDLWIFLSICLLAFIIYWIIPVEPKDNSKEYDTTEIEKPKHRESD